jgi:UDP-N-acetylmuramoyl-L-alanyl-D-glutamate--2,6-diaminopimelate ligase
MSVKQKLVERVRNVLPIGTVRNVEEAYRKGRAKVASAKHGNPAKSVRTVVVVGTNGKTTTARYIKEMLEEAGKTTLLLTDPYGVSYGVDTLQKFLKQAKQQDVAYAVIALGVDDILNHGLDAVPIECTVVTNSSDTSAFSADETTQAIGRLLAQEPRYIVLNRDDPSYETLSEFTAGEQRITYGMHEDAEARITQVKLYKKGSEARLVVDNQTGIDLATYLIGNANVVNVSTAATMMYVTGEDIVNLNEGAARLEQSAGNFQYIDVEAPWAVACDAAPNTAALQSVIGSAREIAGRRLIVALDAASLSDSVVSEIAKQTDRLIIVGAKAPTSGAVEDVDSPETAIRRAMRAARTGDMLLLAGPAFMADRDDPAANLQATITNILQDS